MNERQVSPEIRSCEFAQVPNKIVILTRIKHKHRYILHVATYKIENMMVRGYVALMMCGCQVSTRRTNFSLSKHKVKGIHTLSI